MSSVSTGWLNGPVNSCLASSYYLLMIVNKSILKVKHSHCDAVHCRMYIH